MKILIVTNATTRKSGGVYGAVRGLFTNPAFKNHQLELATFENDGFDDSKWKDFDVKLFKRHTLEYSRPLKSHILNSDADILHMEIIWRYPQLLIPTWKKAKKKPVVFSLHGGFDPYIVTVQGKFKRLVSKLLFDPTLQYVDCFHALCKKELEDIRAYGVDGPVAIIPNGVKLPPEDKHFERPDNKKHLLYLGRLHKKKGVDILLEAFAKVCKELDAANDWHLDIVGWDHEGEKDTLEKIVKMNHLEERVTFQGELFGEDKEHIFATSDAYIMSSHGEGLPLTILEAWSWKVPVIMTRKCNIPEGFDENAAIEIEDNVTSTIEGIKEIMEMSDEDRKSMGERGFQLVKHHFTWDKIAQQMTEVYEWLLGKREKPDFVYLK